MSLFAKVVSFPPLQQITVIPGMVEKFPITILLEASLVFPPLPWEVTIFHRHQSSVGWEQLPLRAISAEPLLLTKEPVELCRTRSRYRHIYTGDLPNSSLVPLSVSFKIRYRLDPYSPWHWVTSQSGVEIGEIIFQGLLPQRDLSLSNFIQLSPDLNVSSLGCSKNGAHCFKITVEACVSEKDDFTVVSKEVGYILNQQRYFALAQVTEPWTAPRHGRQEFDLQEDGTMCCFLNRDGQCITLLALSGLGATQVAIKSTEANSIALRVRNNLPEPASAQVVVSVADTVDASVAGAIDSARRIFAESGHTTVLSDRGLTQLNKSAADYTNAEYSLDDWYDGLAYCTWNSLGWDINPEKIISGLKSLEDNKIRVSTLIIDDNWQTIDESDSSIARMHRAMDRFEANAAFPQGFAAGIAQIRKAHPYVNDIAVWHALLGYWGGITPHGELAKTYQTTTLRAQLWRHTMRTITAIDPEDIHRFYDDFYRFLASCGVTAVKTDVQFMLGELASGERRAAFLDSYCSAWTAAYLTHFQGRAISCMSMIPQSMFRSFLADDLPKVLLRNSDDFFPEVPISHPLHVFNNAHNALLVGHFNVVADWDMFQTSHPYSAFHAAARCLSGGPIYITDCPGEHDIALIHQMSATSPSGRTVTLRPQSNGQTRSVWDDFASRQLLKIGAHCGQGREKGTSILGLFNLDDKDYSCLVPANEVWACGHDTTTSPETPQDEEFLLRSWQDDRYFAPVPKGSSGASTLLYTTIPARGFDIVYAHPIHRIAQTSVHLSSSVLGLLGKMTGPAAVSQWDIVTEESAMVIITVTLKALGVLGVWLSRPDAPIDPDQIAVAVHGHAYSGHPVLKAVENGGVVIELDVLKTWQSLEKNIIGGQSGVTVEIRIQL